MIDQKDGLVYVTGSITGATLEEMALFFDASKQLRERNYRVYNPPEHDIPQAAENESMWTHALCRDIRVITHCVGICVLPTYAWSKGANLEIFTAVSLRKRIILLKDQDVAWEKRILDEVQAVQAILWQNVAREKFLHHTDIPAQ